MKVFDYIAAVFVLVMLGIGGIGLAAFLAVMSPIIAFFAVIND